MVPAPFLAGNIPDPAKHWFATPVQRVPYKIYIREDHKDRVLKLPQAAEELDARWFRRR
jgi:hypothetical protein